MLSNLSDSVKFRSIRFWGVVTTTCKPNYVLSQKTFSSLKVNSDLAVYNIQEICPIPFVCFSLIKIVLMNQNIMST